jgi:hypothetical protein
MQLKEQASESGHWYTKDGEPAYRTERADGKGLRNTTLRDAKKLGLLPSVTTILNVAAKPGLQNWLQQQAILAALTLPRNEGESESDYLDRVLSDSKAQGKDAADRGTQIHGVLEAFFDQVLLEQVPEYCRVTENALKAAFGNRLWISEKSGSHELGFAGKVDLHAKGDKVKGIPPVVCDFKTKEIPLEKVVPYEDHIMQIAAYRELLGLPDARCAIVFVNGLTNEVKVCEIEEAELQKGLKCFFHLLRFYQIKSGLVV